MSLTVDHVMDDHWRPVATQCSLCQLKFDFVLKVENIREEEQFMIRLATKKFVTWTIL